MIKFELNDSNWKTSKQYWNELKKQFIKPDDAKKADFIDRVLFDSSSQNISLNSHALMHASSVDALPTTTTVATPIPSMHIMSEIMSEIDKELKTDEKKNDNYNVIDSKMHEANEDLKQFIRKPVMFLLFVL